MMKADIGLLRGRGVRVPSGTLPGGSQRRSLSSMPMPATDTQVGGGRRVAVIGAGPSGFYASEQLLAKGFEVDLIDLLPTPFGLVRAGVAPDHPKIKSVTRMYEKTAKKDGFRFFGGIELGRDITRADLLARYHAVLY